MTLSDETVDRAAREPSDAELAYWCIKEADFQLLAGANDAVIMLRRIAQRLEARGISEAMVEAARKFLWDVGRVFVRSDDIRAALEAALKDEP